MPIHDWTRVPAGIFHDFHCSWAPHIKEALNEGLLPEGYYALIEQSVPVVRPDLITLSGAPQSKPGSEVETATMTPPRTRKSLDAKPMAQYRQKRRTVSVRHVSGHQIVALIEIASPANKDRASSVEQFVEKISQAVRAGIHVLLIDILPPGKFDPHGLHGEFWQEYDPEAEEEPLEASLCLASYEALDLPKAFLEPLSVGDALPDMPLFYDRGLYVNVPLERTYDQAWRGVPEFWRDVVEGRRTIQN